MFNWRILLGGAASAAILTVGVAAPAFAVPRASTPVPLNGITQGVSGSNVGGVFCALPNLPVSLGVSAAAGAIGESCGSTQMGGSSQSVITDPLQGDGQQGDGQVDGPARAASSAASALPGLNSVSGSIPDVSNAASVVPDLGNVAGSVTGAVGNVTGGLPGGGQAGGPATGSIP